MVTPREIELYEERDVIIVDTLQDLEGPTAAAPPRVVDTADERHEQELASILE